MTYTEYVRLSEQIETFTEERDLLDDTIKRLSVQRREGAEGFPDQFYIRVGSKMVLRTHLGNGIRIVVPKLE